MSVPSLHKHMAGGYQRVFSSPDITNRSIVSFCKRQMHGGAILCAWDHLLPLAIPLLSASRPCWGEIVQWCRLSEKDATHLSQGSTHNGILFFK